LSAGLHVASLFISLSVLGGGAVVWHLLVVIFLARLTVLVSSLIIGSILLSSVLGGTSLPADGAAPLILL
jgi:hypothetical protein